MSDDEVIRFEITDYDLDNEFSIRSRRTTKEQQIYGVWAKDSDEEENEDNIRRKSRKQKDYSAPIGFVAGGVQQSSKKKTKEPKELLPCEPSATAAITDSSDSEGPASPIAQDTAGLRGTYKPVQLGGDLGNWEKHTKGIGAKLLLRMGYQPGKGLGKDLQGISAPVEATLRKGRGAIGAYGPEKSTQKAKKEEEKRLKEKEVEEEPEKKSYHWKKSHKGRYFYRDAADVIQEGKPTLHTIASNSLSQVPVIDMRGRECRVLSGYHALRAVAPRYEHHPRRQCTHFAAPELTHNLDLMVDICEQDIIQNARELQNAEDEIVVLERDLQQCNIQISEHDVYIDTMQAIISKIEELNRPDLCLEDAFETLADIKTHYPLEYEIFNVSAAGATVLSSLLVAIPWKVLSEPLALSQHLLKARALLDESSYHTLLYECVFTQIEAAAVDWNPRFPEPMLGVYAMCIKCSNNMCAVSKCVLSKVQSAVAMWDPTRDTQPLHEWLLPWHQYLGEELSSSVYPIVRSRLATALQSWHPADRSALPLLSVWKVWGPALTVFVQQYIVPKLEVFLQQASVELAAGNYTSWQICVEWLPLAGIPVISALATRHVLPIWLATLTRTLNTTTEHSALLTAYIEFKKTFPEEILKEPTVSNIFRKALDMMNRSADIDPNLEAPLPPRITLPEHKDMSRLAEVIASSNTQKSFSELLESKCVEKGITFVPVAGKFREGRPVYKIGDTMQCYVLRNVIMYSPDSGRTYLPISMDKLLKIADD